MEASLSQASRREPFRDLASKLIVETVGATCRGSARLIRCTQLEIRDGGLGVLEF
jgi:hypothetical protein